MKKTSGKFKSKYKPVLYKKDVAPDSMEAFLKGEPAGDRTLAQTQKTASTQIHNSTDAQPANTRPESKENLGRLHIQIRQDLIEKLLESVYQRKRDSMVKNRDATQRAIIEEALEKYFQNE